MGPRNYDRYPTFQNASLKRKRTGEERPNLISPHAVAVLASLNPEARRQELRGDQEELFGFDSCSPMAALAPGVLLKLLHGMSTGAARPVGEHRNALLQVTDIVPAELDEKDLWPKHGFYIKISDSSHSIYASLPCAQDDLVLSNKLQLGQFIYVDRLDPGSPVPFVIGAKPLPGRHPLVGTPEPIVRSKTHTGEKSNSKSSSVHRRRGSWGPELIPACAASSPIVVKPVMLDFEESTPVKGVTFRSSVSGGLLSKMAETKGESAVRKSCTASRFPRSKSAYEREPRIPKSPFPIEKSLVTPPSRARCTKVVDPDEENKSASKKLTPFLSGSVVPKNGSDDHQMSFPGKLSAIGKEAMQHREAAQKLALQALRDASATENLVRVLKMFAELSASAKPESPAVCFDRFFGFHQEIIQAVTDMEAIQAATSTASMSEKESTIEKLNESEHPLILHEIKHNSTNLANVSASKRRTAATISKSVSFTAETNELKAGLGKHPKISACQKGVSDKKRSENAASDESRKEQPLPTSRLSISIKLAKQIQTEAGNWFMEFLETALETGLKKAKGDGRRKGDCCCPQSLILKVINWVEMEQSDSSKRPVHPKAAQIARKLRIKAKNP